MTAPRTLVTSTADLTPAGIKGYLKAVAAVVGLLGTVLAAVQPAVAPGSDWARWLGLAIAACSAFSVWYAKNYVQPVVVVDANPDVPAGPPAA